MWLKLTELSTHDFPERIGYKYVNMDKVVCFSEYDLDTTFIELQEGWFIVQESVDEIYNMLQGGDHQ